MAKSDLNDTSLAEAVLDNPIFLACLEQTQKIVNALQNAEGDNKKSLKVLLNIQLRYIFSTLHGEDLKQRAKAYLDQTNRKGRRDV